MEIKVGIHKDEMNSIIDWSYKFFDTHISKTNFAWIVCVKTNWRNSLKLVNDKNEIVGVYLLGDSQLNIKECKGLLGVEGVLLVINEDIRGNGWGTKLKEYPNQLGFDYIWGQQMKSLNNLSDWLKRRKLIHDVGELYVTLEIFTKMAQD